MQNKATIALGWFETAKRSDGSEFVRLQAEAPKDLRDLVYEAHERGQIMPDDWRYAFIVDAFTLLSENSDPDSVQVEPSVYNTELIDWLGSHRQRPGYVDEACEELGAEAPSDVISRIMAGQILEREEILAIVRGWLASEGS